MKKFVLSISAITFIVFMAVVPMMYTVGMITSAVAYGTGTFVIPLCIVLWVIYFPILREATIETLRFVLRGVYFFFRGIARKKNRVTKVKVTR